MRESAVAERRWTRVAELEFTGCEPVRVSEAEILGPEWEGRKLEEDLEGGGVEHRGKDVDELAAQQADRAETGDGLSRRGMEDDGVLVFGRDPHATAGAVALEVAFVLAPQLNIAAPRQTAEFF